MQLLCYCSRLKEYHIGPFILHLTVLTHYTATVIVRTTFSHESAAFGFLTDQGVNVLAARSILHSGKPRYALPL